ncbi:MAG: hypothetical protein Kow00121_25020 [Elainellaceae cyanobacterium]
MALRTEYFADVVLDYFDSGAGPIPGPYGRVDPDNDGFDEPGEPPLGAIGIEALLGDDPGPGINYVSLPTGSYVTVGFVNGFIIDGPGNDLFIRETGRAGDRADVFVSGAANPTEADFVYLGRATDNVTTSFDLATIGFTQTVRAVKIVGLDNRGTSPGFDVVNIQGLQIETPNGSRVLTGDDNNNVLQGGKRNDFLLGNGGNDLIVGDAGNDDLAGGEGNDRIRDGKGNDRVKGGEGSDRIFCAEGKDTVILDVLDRGFQDFDVIRGFKDRQDKLGIERGTRFRQLDFIQRGNRTIVSYFGTNIASLVGVQADQVTRADIKIIPKSDPILG